MFGLQTENPAFLTLARISKVATWGPHCAPPSRAAGIAVVAWRIWKRSSQVQGNDRTGVIQGLRTFGVCTEDREDWDSNANSGQLQVEENMDAGCTANEQRRCGGRKRDNGAKDSDTHLSGEGRE